MMLLGDVGQVEKVRERARDRQRLVQGHVREHVGERGERLVAGSRAPLPLRQRTHTLDGPKNVLAGVGLDACRRAAHRAAAHRRAAACADPTSCCNDTARLQGTQRPVVRVTMPACKVVVSVIVAAVLLVVPALPHAQWPAHPDRNVPRTPDGTVNLQAPAPRTADGKPDFTGVWQNAWFTDGRVQPLPVSPDGEPPAATFGDVFANFKGNLPLQPWAAKLKADRHEQNSKENPDAHCLPMGLIQFHMHPQPRKVIQTPDVVAILYEGNARSPADPHRRPVTADRRSAAVVVRLLHRPLGRRHARGRDQRIQRRRLARHPGQPADRRREDDRTVAAAELRHDADRHHDRRSEGLHAAVLAQDSPSADDGREVRCRADRVRLPGEQPGAAS